MNKLSSMNVLRIALGSTWALFTFVLFIAQPFYDLGTLFMSYAFVTIAFLFILGITFYKSPGKPLGAYMPVMLLTFGYLFLQLLLCIIFVCVTNIVPTTITWYQHFYWQVPILIIVIILFLLQHAAMKHVGKNEQRRAEVSASHERIALSINKSAATGRGARVRDELDNVQMQIRFMDLMQHPELEQADQDIINEVTVLNDLIVNGTDEEIVAQCKRVKQVVKQRKDLSSLLQRQ